jgi:hypothetical protein
MALDSPVFNARYNNIRSIAESFVVNDQYLELLKPNHSIITGPRGCGKTTLLKMLTPDAIDIISKNHKHIPIPNFLGIYIPADKQWLRQHLTLKKRIVDENVYKPIIRCLINANCFISILNTIDYLCQSKTNGREMLKDVETAISRDIKNVFSLGNDFPNTFYHIKQFFYTIIRNLNTQINKYYFGYLSIKDLELHDISFLEITDLVQPVYEIFYSNIKQFEIPISQQSWALCFDELEISPSWVINELISTYFRSTYQNLLLKVTGTPIISSVSESSISAPQVNHDFNRIECWVYDANSRRRWVSFCEKMIHEKYEINQVNKLLGDHDYTDALVFSEKNLNSISQELAEWSNGSVMWNVMVRLAKIDKSFYNFLVAKGLDPEDPVPSRGQTDSIHRKIKPIVAFRYYFNKIDSKRSRKAVHLYYGVEHLYELTDGNPRMFLTLLARYDYYFKNKMKVPINVQAQNISEFSNDVHSTFRDDPEGFSFNEYSLQKLLDKVGNFIFTEIVDGPFTSDPNSSFVVENSTSENIKRLVIYGLETGALQLIKQQREKHIDSIIDKRIRLSYALHPKYRIPKRTYNSIRLENILGIADSLTLFENEV